MHGSLEVLRTQYGGFLALIVIGGLAGWIAGMILRIRHGVLTNIIVGVAGAWIGSELADLAGRCDVVLIDAPCTGSGSWRRNPDAKWRVRPGALEQRIKDQHEILERAAGYVKPGGHLVYVTCSLLKAENEDRVAAFLAAHEAFLPLEAAHWASACGLPALAAQASSLGVGFRFSPLRTATDGFYVAPLVRSA